MLFQQLQTSVPLCQHRRGACVPQKIQRLAKRLRPMNHVNGFSNVSSWAHPTLRKSKVCVSTEESATSTTTQDEQQAPTSSNAVHTDALIVGGGPAGLAAAIMLAKRGWNVTVAERHAQFSYADPDRSYVYAIDGRGRQFTDKYGITPKLAEAGVDTAAVDVTRVFPSGKVVTSRQNTKDEARIVYWLPRMNFVRLMEFCAKDPQYAQYITLVTNTEATAIERVPSSSSSSSSGDSKKIQVTLRNTVTGNEMTFVPKLLLGCDGQNSLVRKSMKSWALEDGTLGYTNVSSSSSKFTMLEYPSLSTNLRFKVLQLPPNPAMKDGTVLRNPSFCLLAGQKSSLIGGAPLRLGLLPIKDETAGRTANLITLPDHPVWSVTDAETLFKVFEQSLPQADWRALVPEAVMAKFAASKGGAFPAPQFSKGLSLLVADKAEPDPAAKPDAVAIKGAGALLLGDAAHCFPPDLGQGVNSALEDVCVLEQQLEAAGNDLTKALPAYEQQRLPDAEALVKLVQTGYPLQYNQYPLRRALWNVTFFAQFVAHKLLPSLVSPPLFLMIQNPAMRYSNVLDATERTRKVLAGLGVLLAAGLAWLLQKLLPKVVTGAVTGSV